MSRASLSVLTEILISAAAATAYGLDDDIMIVGPVVKMVRVTVGTVVSMIGADTGEKEGSVTVAEESGETKVFPIDATAKIIDGTLGAITLRDLKEGQKVKVEHAERDNGEDKVRSVEVVK